MPEPSKHPKRKIILIIFTILLCIIIYEWRTSLIQSWMFSSYAKKLQFTVGEGQSPDIIFPGEGPADKARGYARIPAFVKNLEQHGYKVVRQARFSPELMKAARMGISPPYEEKSVAGLTILDQSGDALYESIRRDRIYGSFDEIPDDVINILLFIENRELLKPADEHKNPVLEWDRIAKAGVKYVGKKFGLPVPVEGGSTLATQLEKYQHSEGGRTGSVKEKIRQITSASLKAYRTGRDTTVSRREIVLDYINTMPLASAAGYGEVYGFGEGIWAWFGEDIKNISNILKKKENSPERADAFKKVMALFSSVKAPSFYLIKDREALMGRVDYFTDMLLKEKEIDSEFHGMLKAASVNFRSGRISLPQPSFAERKAPNTIRHYLLKTLDLPDFYDLDRLDVTIHSTLDADMQKQATLMLKQLTDTRYVESAGLTRDRMLKHGDPKNLIYSFLLYEKTPSGNALRVQADNLDKPFDINEGVKLDLGSTAKLRTLAHYLQMISDTYKEMSAQSPEALNSDPLFSKDPISRWMKQKLIERPDVTLEEMLNAALERKFSANPKEVFFTGGGEHTFANFNKADNNLTMPVSEGIRDSVNLVFIRLMREIVNYHTARLGFDTKAVLEDMNHPMRKDLLKQVTDKESLSFLSQFTSEYRGLPLDQSIKKLLGSRNTSARHLAILFYAINPSASSDELAQWLRERRPEVSEITEGTIKTLSAKYGGARFNLSDYGYLLSRHPLELWTIGYLDSHPQADWEELLRESAGAREESGSWLLHTRHKQAQDTRLRILFEEMAFKEIHKGWKRLGYPFDSLVPSLATSIGSSADRPAALAEIIGIILNDGVRMPSLKLTSLEFAKGTPYETEMSLKTEEGERVMPAEVANVLRRMLADVVKGGTARAVYGALKDAEGNAVVIGGKTGSGDNRFEYFAKGGKLISSRVVNRTATFAFYIGDRYFGVITAFMPGEGAADYSFTSSLPVNILRLLAPTLQPLVVPEG
jgi:membrane peptidoglycan carboxypeptidase